jgi:hypothetical protein
MNGLVGMVGSSNPETFELRELLEDILFCCREASGIVALLQKN